MKEEEQIRMRMVQLEDEILFTKAKQYQNFFRGSNLEGEEIRGAYLALAWVLENENPEV